MVDFKVGDLVTWLPEHYGYRDKNNCPDTFVISAFYAGYIIVWGGATKNHANGCPGACSPWLQLAEGPW